MNLDKILPAAKAWAALIGAIVTALLGTVAPDTALFDVLTGIAAVATAVTVYRVPNKRIRRVKFEVTGGGKWVDVPTFTGPVKFYDSQGRLRTKGEED